MHQNQGGKKSGEEALHSLEGEGGPLWGERGKRGLERLRKGTEEDRFERGGHKTGRICEGMIRGPEGN